MQKLRLGLAQINTTVGDFPGNLEKMLHVLTQAREAGVDLLAFPELAICGYPPEDLLLKPHFVAKNLQYLDNLAQATAGITVVAGFVDAEQDCLFNAAAVLHDGKLKGVYHKILLPNYGVFDEKRYFTPGRSCPVFWLGGFGVGVNICEDIWSDSGPAAAEACAGAELILNISASPYHYGKAEQREKMLCSRATSNLSVVAYTNLVGGQDELIFDGASLVVDELGRTLARGREFAEDLLIVDIETETARLARGQNPRWCLEPQLAQQRGWATPEIPVALALTEEPKPAPPVRQLTVLLPLPAEIYHALVLGTRDYLDKNGFKKAVIGLSGGIDSSLVAAVAADALGKENVIGVGMPSRFSSPGSLADAEKLARNLGIRFLTLPIEKAYQAYLDSLAGAFDGVKPDTTEENIQARIRGNFLMALSNKFGWLVLTTGNKSEMATGYATLYGDMAGGFALLKDVPKTTVYELVHYRNQQTGCDLIPQAVIDKPPSAELRPGQRDTDTLPPYDMLDPILKSYVEEDKSLDEMLALGLDEAAVRNAVRLVDQSEYKRRQSPPGIKITARAFGRDRRLPITNKFKGDT
jgi:NAD+ synthase (glutamine-hydrolysing)